MADPAGLTVEAEQMVSIGPVGLAQVVDVFEESFLVQVGDAARELLFRYSVLQNQLD